MNNRLNKDTIALLVAKSNLLDRNVYRCIFDPPIKEWNEASEGYIFVTETMIEFYHLNYYSPETKEFNRTGDGNRNSLRFYFPQNKDPISMLKTIGITLISSSKELDSNEP